MADDRLELQYLLAIESLCNRSGCARTTDLAHLLNVSRGAAAMMTQRLKRQGWVEENGDRLLVLSDEGRRKIETDLKQ